MMTPPRCEQLRPVEPVTVGQQRSVDGHNYFVAPQRSDARRPEGSHARPKVHASKNLCSPAPLMLSDGPFRAKAFFLKLHPYAHPRFLVLAPAGLRWPSSSRQAEGMSPWIVVRGSRVLLAAS